jgi:hypothetical protein
VRNFKIFQVRRNWTSLTLHHPIQIFAQTELSPKERQNKTKQRKEEEGRKGGGRKERREGREGGKK